MIILEMSNITAMWNAAVDLWSTVVKSEHILLAVFLSLQKNDKVVRKDQEQPFVLSQCYISYLSILDNLIYVI